MPRITEVFLYIAADANSEDEGVTAYLAPSGEWMPMVGADMERAQILRPVAQTLAMRGNKTIRLVKFTHMEELEVFRP